MNLVNRILQTTIFSFLLAATMVAADGKLLKGEKTSRDDVQNDGFVIHRCLTPSANDLITLPVNRKNPWSLPDKALASDFDRTINILVLRFNFQYEEEDDSSTTGRGYIDISNDSAAFYDANEHYIDPPPHDSAYFDAHMKALDYYYETVSNNKMHLNWDIFPSGNDAIYQLSHPMSYYGACVDELDPEIMFDSVIVGLERYFVDCIRLADSTTPGINFSDYESIFLFHAGSDQQNNIGYPPTCRDMFTGFIRFGDSIMADDGTIFVKGIPVDDGADTVRTALLLPETASQDGRATAMNAVIAHEFGHQLGLVDLYRTGNFRTQLGDFALMDNNGFGTGIDFGFPVGSVFGINPIYPCAWSRAFLGFDEVVDFRQGSDIRLVAAEVVSDGIKIARVPISDEEYYLIENRIVDTDGKMTFIKADSITSVVQGPSDEDRNLTGEYDHLMPGSGVIIYHVDESVARMDFNNNGVSNFYENQLQLDPRRRFIRIVEADGIVDLGGYYNAGFGSEEDMYREDRNNSLTPNTNPPSIDNTGNNTHVRITNIHRQTVSTEFQNITLDSVVLFDVETEGLVDNFPVRVGYRFLAGILEDENTGEDIVARFNTLRCIADDLDKDGTDEIITASNEKVLAFTTTGQNFLNSYTGCDPCQSYTDEAISRFDIESPNFVSGEERYRSNDYIVPMYFQTPGFITAGPATGDFGQTDSLKLVAAGILLDVDSGAVVLNYLQDNNDDSQADNFITFTTEGWPIEISFGEVLYAVTNAGVVYIKDGFNADPVTTFSLDVDNVFGTCRNGNDLIILTETNNISEIYYYYYTAGQFLEIYELDNNYNLGPILADVNRDDNPEIILTSSDGNLLYMTINNSNLNTLNNTQIFSVLSEDETGFSFEANPIAGDVNQDGFPEVILTGENKIYAYDNRMLFAGNFPKEIDDRFLDDRVFSSPVIADVETGGMSEIIFPTEVGNVYSISEEATFGFPLSGGERSNGSILLINDNTGIKLGYNGDDGWFYLWDFWASDFDEITGPWLMDGADPAGSNAFDMSKLKIPAIIAELLPESKYFCYPNPVTTGATTIRYTLGQTASEVNLTIYDLSGEEIVNLTGTNYPGVNETEWSCGNISPGVYRCVINAEFNGQSENAFTDIAVIR